MSYPGKVARRVLQQFSRFGLFRNNRNCSRFGSTVSYLTCIQGADKLGISQLLTREFLHTASAVRAMAALSPNDPSSYSRPELAIVRHVSLALDVDFGKKVLSGSAVLNLEALQDVDQVILDARDLTINSIELDNGTELKYTLDGTLDDFGSKLTIELPHVVAPNEKTNMCKLLSYDHAPDSISSKPTKPIEYGKNASQTVLEPNISEPECLFKTWPGDVKPTGFHLDPQENSGSCQSCKCESDVNTAKIEVESSVLNKNNSLADTEKERDEVKEKEIEESDNNELKEKGYKVICVFDRPVKTELEDDTKVSYEPRFNVRIKYNTAPNASALQWLEPSQTSGKEYPYMFSQCQPIHARSILPCQDTPSVKFTYDARVTAPEEFTVLMSALRNNSDSNVTTFKQPVPIPSYLLAIAVGVLEHRTLGPRSIVWTEKEEIERAAWEFNDTEKYLQAAERLCGSYVWSQYDLLVLPPSFPYGGMENPCLTFVTPTLLAGDRSQADVIVHEIMHSWTGNLVTNKNFEHFWLNEGFTVFLERKVAASLIQDPVESKRSRDFHSLLGLQELSEAVNGQFTPNNPLTRLVPDLKGVHPDDAFSRVPYEKGSLFLRYLEDLVGGPVVFNGFLQAYLSRFQKQSIDTDQFKAYLLDYFKGSRNYEILLDVDWNTWLYTPGMPPIIPAYDNTMTKAVTALLMKLSDVKYAPTADDVKAFSPHQIIHLLQELIDRPPLHMDKLETIGSVYGIAESKNSEIVYRWLRLCVRSKNQSRLNEVFNFVNTQGRMKYVRPIYRDLYAWEEVRQRAIHNFLANEKFMMHVSAYTVRKDLHLSD